MKGVSYFCSHFSEITRYATKVTAAIQCVDLKNVGVVESAENGDAIVSGPSAAIFICSVCSENSPKYGY